MPDTATGELPCKKVRGPIEKRYVVPYPPLEYPGCAYNCKIKLVRPRKEAKNDRYYDVGPLWRGDEVQFLRAYGGSRRWAFWVLLSFTGEVVAVDVDGGFAPASPIAYVDNVLYAHTGYVFLFYFALLGAWELSTSHRVQVYLCDNDGGNERERNDS
jgi:hypothetical protein